MITHKINVTPYVFKIVRLGIKQIEIPDDKKIYSKGDILQIHAYYPFFGLRSIRRRKYFVTSVKRVPRSLPMLSSILIQLVSVNQKSK